MPSDHRLTAKQAIHPRELVGEIFIGGAKKATVLRAVTEDYLRRSEVDIKLDHGVDNMAMAMSLVASTRGLALMPAYAKNLLSSSVVSRPLEGEAPTIEVAVGYSKSNTSPILNCSCRASMNWWVRTRSTDAVDPASCQDSGARIYTAPASRGSTIHNIRSNSWGRQVGSDCESHDARGLICNSATKRIDSTVRRARSSRNTSNR